MEIFRLILALLPFSLFCLLLLLRPTASLLKISLISLVATLVIAVIFWSIPGGMISFSLFRGILTALDILMIIFGAILFMDILRLTGVTKSLAYYLDNFSPDFRVQVIMLAWFLENFLEGIAGFGTPSTVVAPLLMALGLSPVQSVIISLLGNSTSVPFGAVGTPIRVGFAGLDLDPIAIASTTAAFNYIGLLVPVFMLWVLVVGKPKWQQLFWGAFPFAVWSGTAFVLPSFLVSLFGYEFPSIFGSILGVLLVLITSRLGLFVPRPVYRHPGIKVTTPLSLFKTILPYGLFILLLILAKLLLTSAVIPIPKLSTSLNLFNPGIILVISAITVAVYSAVARLDLFTSSRLAARKSIEPFFVIATMTTVVQLMSNSGNPGIGLSSMTTTLSGLFNTRFLPAIAPFVGAFGSFITGSATVSDIMFGPSLFSSSLHLGLDPVKVLALALVGAGSGNMIALADVLVAKTVVDAPIHLRDLILKLLPYCLICLVLAAGLGLIL